MNVEYLRVADTYADVLFRLSAGNLEAPVPACPGWRLRHLVHHLGNVAFFVSAAIDAAGPEPEFTDAALPADSELRSWAAAELGSLLDRLRTLDRDLEVWNWSQEPQRLGFWPRCLAHEVLVHAWDAHDALGRRLELPVDACLDGIDEVLAIHLPLRTGDVMASSWTAVVRAAEDTAWFVEVERGKVTTTRTTGPLPVPDVLLSGTAEQLYLGLWGRTPLPRVHGTLDRARALCTG
ncbi:maleylpyruvate isomerase family mycothiol-dependent enzyme [Amycolatopsis nigrescens]|uniref:maleylpyruvate isomerase family mycothiol-dependent enzyme n=1 Tax=Amycolatopsis nigrescens TaxID=381445 RepID=UPI00035D54FC|nr:maleylpyruvate isomerase family mycothiol-dependent enzyme [Amycolatopsis nigrescens]